MPGFGLEIGGPAALRVLGVSDINACYINFADARAAAAKAEATKAGSDSEVDESDDDDDAAAAHIVAVAVNEDRSTFDRAPFDFKLEVQDRNT